MMSVNECLLFMETSASSPPNLLEATGHINAARAPTRRTLFYLPPASRLLISCEFVTP